MYMKKPKKRIVNKQTMKQSNKQSVNVKININNNKKKAPTRTAPVSKKMPMQFQNTVNTYPLFREMEQPNPIFYNPVKIPETIKLQEPVKITEPVKIPSFVGYETPLKSWLNTPTTSPFMFGEKTNEKIPTVKERRKYVKFKDASPSEQLKRTRRKRRIQIRNQIDNTTEEL